MKSRTLIYGSNMLVYILAAIGLVVLVNYVAASYPKRYDFSESGRNTLSSQSIKILENLPFKVMVLAFVRENPALRIRPRRLLEQYQYHSTDFVWEFVDPDKRPAISEKYEVTSYDVFIVVGPDGKRERIFGKFTEESLTNALIRAVSTEEKIIYFVGGHGEKAINDTGPRGFSKARIALIKDNLTVKELILYSEESVPADAAAVVVAGPKKDLFKGEIEKLEKYLQAGGRLLFMVDPFVLDSSLAFLEQYGIRPRQDIIVDQVSKSLGGDNLAPTVPRYEPHPITKDFRLMTFFPMTRSLEITKGKKEGVTVLELAKSLPNAWGEVSQAELAEGVATYVKGEDNSGPLTIAAVAEIKSQVDKKINKGELIVIGDSEFAANAYANVSGNLDFFLNIVNWMAEEEDRVAIRPRQAAMDPIALSSEQLYALSGIAVIALPGLILFVGIWINVRRRRA